MTGEKYVISKNGNYYCKAARYGTVVKKLLNLKSLEGVEVRHPGFGRMSALRFLNSWAFPEKAPSLIRFKGGVR